MRWLTPCGTQHFSFIEQTKSFPLIFGVKHPVFDQLMKPELERVFNHAKDTMATIVFVNSQTLKEPQLVPKVVFGLGAILPGRGDE